MAEPAYQRLDVDERRAQLLELGARLFTEHEYDELSMARIAREAGISKALLYHYFPSKQAFFVATLERGAGELAALIVPDPDAPPAEALTGTLDAFLGWIDQNSDTYLKVMRSATGHAEVRELIEEVRAQTATTLLDGLTGGEPAPPAVRSAVRGWLWFMDGVCQDWLENRDLERGQVQGLLIGTLAGAIMATGETQLLTRLTTA
ncbi:MAG: TetR/AcrR family transcriptional regulator [Solirubrobacteraceae bacterium]|nr:TetR/AcrR family transcriptional regulator [Solirubrobacteraceae bacterium]